MNISRVLIEMKRDLIQNLKGVFLSILGLILSLAIILIFSYMILNSYFKSPVLNKEAEKSLSEQGIDTSSHKAILDSTKERVQDINKQILDRAEAIGQ